jgi:hypothetical protein
MAFLKLVFTLLYNLTQFAQPNCGKEVVPLQPPIQNKTGMFPLSLRYHQLADTIYLYVTKTEPIYVHNTCTKFSGTYSNLAECRHATRQPNACIYSKYQGYTQTEGSTISN